MTVLAALAAIPGRADILPSVLHSLRPQVDVLCVYLNGWNSVPECVRGHCDDYVVSSTNQGAERKTHWADKHDGIYLSCDDDFEYPPDYAAAMVAEVERFSGEAIVTAHGRAYLGKPRDVHDVMPGSIGMYYRNVPCGRWVNYAGTGVTAWHAGTVKVPTRWEQRNNLDAQFAVWAQREQVPMWLLKHEGHWLKTYRPLDPNGIFKSSQRERHRTRSGIISRYGKEQGWLLYRVGE